MCEVWGLSGTYITISSSYKTQKYQISASLLYFECYCLVWVVVQSSNLNLSLFLSPIPSPRSPHTYILLWFLNILFPFSLIFSIFSFKQIRFIQFILCPRDTTLKERCRTKPLWNAKIIFLSLPPHPHPHLGWPSLPAFPCNTSFHLFSCSIS